LTKTGGCSADHEPVQSKRYFGFCISAFCTQQNTQQKRILQHLEVLFEPLGFKMQFCPLSILELLDIKSPDFTIKHGKTGLLAE